MAPAAKILERMVNQNTFDDVTMGIVHIYIYVFIAIPQASGQAHCMHAHCMCVLRSLISRRKCFLDLCCQIIQCRN